MKKSILFSLLLSGLLMGTSVLVTSCGSKSDQSEQSSDDKRIDGDEEVAYACPMHPEITGKEGDTCSKCGMDLEKVSDDESDTHHHDHE